MNYPWQNILYIDGQGKTVPYQAPLDKASTGIGFINLKTQPDTIDNIPEALNDADLYSALGQINGPETGVFSIGCHGEQLEDENGYRATGYIEIAVNDQSTIRDAATYFTLYFQFHNRLIQSRFSHAVQFDWVILPAVFTELGVQGFTCSIKMNFASYPTRSQSQSAWASALSLLASFLAEVGAKSHQQIY